ncbi:MAG TPA: hypothetical protein VIK86_08235 [Candidatus Paceibacterota bacterium]
MKESLLKIKNKIISFKKINPHNHWNILLYIFFAIIIVLVIFSLYLLIDLRNQQSLQMTPGFVETPSLMNEKLLNKVTESFSIKALKEKAIKDGVTSYKDPSI